MLHFNDYLSVLSFFTAIFHRYFLQQIFPDRYTYHRQVNTRRSSTYLICYISTKETALVRGSLSHNPSTVHLWEFKQHGNIRSESIRHTAAFQTVLWNIWKGGGGNSLYVWVFIFQNTSHNFMLHTLHCCWEVYIFRFPSPLYRDTR
jgi:hypothetical protein